MIFAKGNIISIRAVCGCVVRPLESGVGRANALDNSPITAFCLAGGGTATSFNFGFTLRALHRDGSFLPVPKILCSSFPASPIKGLRGQPSHSIVRASFTGDHCGTTSRIFGAALAVVSRLVDGDLTIFCPCIVFFPHGCNHLGTPPASCRIWPA